MNTPEKPAAQPSDWTDWHACHADAINELVIRSRSESRRAAIKKIGLTSAGIVCATAGGLTWWNRKPVKPEKKKQKQRDQMVIAIKCENVKLKLVAYHQEDLCEGLDRRITCHLRHCMHCVETYRSLYGKEMRMPDSTNCGSVRPV